MNVGFWSTVPVGATEGETNRMIERRVSELDGHKSLYSDAFYSRGGVRRAVRRRGVSRGEAAIRSGFPASRPLRQGGATTMITFTENAAGPSDASRDDREAHARRDPRDLRRRSPAAADHGIRRELGGPRRRAVRPGAEDAARHHLPRDRPRRSRARPRLHRRRPRHPRRAPRRSVRPAQGARGEPRVRPAAGEGHGADRALDRRRAPEAHRPAAAGGAAALAARRRRASGTARARDAEAIHHHYDVSNTFYEWVLGPSMTYTCACYPSSGCFAR